VDGCLVVVVLVSYVVCVGLMIWLVIRIGLILNLLNSWVWVIVVIVILVVLVFSWVVMSWGVMVVLLCGISLMLCLW